MKTSVAKLIELLEKLPVNAEVEVMARETIGFTEITTVEELDLTPLPGLKPELHSADDVTCLETKHIRIKDTRNVKGMAPLNRKVVVTIGGDSK